MDFDFKIEDTQSGIRVLVDKIGGRRPATTYETAMWDRLEALSHQEAAPEVDESPDLHRKEVDDHAKLHKTPPAWIDQRALRVAADWLRWADDHGDAPAARIKASLQVAIIGAMQAAARPAESAREALTDDEIRILGTEHGLGSAEFRYVRSFARALIGKQKEGTPPADPPPDWLNRRAQVEQELLNAARGKGAFPDAAKLREWALRLGTPTEYQQP